MILSDLELPSGRYCALFLRMWQLSESTASQRLALDPYGESSLYRATACNATHSIALAILSVRLSDACIVTKLNYALQIF